jgi:TRAP-type mannitol/chloroaromatic compound transport system permease large subunit
MLDSVILRSSLAMVIVTFPMSIHVTYATVLLTTTIAAGGGVCNANIPDSNGIVILGDVIPWQNVVEATSRESTWCSSLLSVIRLKNTKKART